MAVARGVAGEVLAVRSGDSRRGGGSMGWSKSARRSGSSIAAVVVVNAFCRPRSASSRERHKKTEKEHE